MGLSLDLEGSTLVVWAAISTTSQLLPLSGEFPSAPATLAPPGQGLASPRLRKDLPTPRRSLGRPHCALDVGILSILKLAPTLSEVPALQEDPGCWKSRGGVNIGNVGCYIYDPVDIRSK